jgi:glycosyltransferase involved in cell wall biosynthesis
VDDYDFAIDYSAFHLVGQHFPNKCVSLMGGDAYKKYPHDTVHNKVYNSKEFAAFNGSSDWINGPIEMYPDRVKFIEKPLNYFLYVGIIHPMKGLHIAAQACKEVNKPFLIYGPIRDEAYWNTFKNDVTYCGMLGSINRDEVLGNAIAFLHPTQVCDANPTAPQEAMYRGTPVIACPNGGIVSRIQDGVTGYFAENVKNYVDKINIVDKIDRKLVRQSIIDQTDPVMCTKELLNFVNLKIFKKDSI